MTTRGAPPADDTAGAALAAHLCPQVLCLSRQRVIIWCNARFAGVFEPIAPATEPDTLSPRQHEVLGGLLCGMTSKQAAQSLGLGHRMVAKYRSQLLLKYRAPDTTALVQRVLQGSPRENALD